MSHSQIRGFRMIQGIKSPVCSVGICTAMSLKKNKLLQRILKHIEAQHCGSGEVELEDAVDPCTLLTKNYQHDHESLTAKLKLVETQLEALDPSWSKGQLSTSMIDVPADGSESVLLLSIYQLGSQRNVPSKASPRVSTSSTLWRISLTTLTRARGAPWM